jgi:hypothetical protein
VLELFAACAAGFLSRLDLVGEQAGVQRAGRFVLLNVLTFGLIALDEVPLDATEATRPLEANHHRFGHHGAPELARTTSTHVGRLSFLTTPFTIRCLGDRDNGNTRRSIRVCDLDLAGA